MIFTRTNSGIDHITQLRGTRFAFGEAGSALEDLFPKAKLVATDYRREDFLLVINFPNDAVLAAVGSREWDVGVAPVEYVLPLTGPGKEFKILDKVQAPGHLWLARTNLDPTIAQAVLSALLAARDEDMLARFKSNLTGFQSAQPSDYDALARDIETADRFDQPR